MNGVVICVYDLFDVIVFNICFWVVRLVNCYFFWVMFKVSGVVVIDEMYENYLVVLLCGDFLI